MNKQYYKILIVAFLIFLFIFFAGLAGRGITLRYLFDLIIIRPVGKVLVSLKNFANDIRSFNAILKQKAVLERENESLKDQVNLLQERLKLMVDIYYENTQLKAELKIKEKKLFEFVNANIIGYDYINHFISIDCGTNDGISRNMPVVVSFDGETVNLIGLVSEAAKSTSSVMLLTSPYFKVGVRILGKAGFEVLYGNSENLKIDSFISTYDVAVNDIFVTSDVSGVYPKDLFVGKVYEVNQKSSVEREILLKSLVNLDSLLRVMVITKHD